MVYYNAATMFKRKEITSLFYAINYFVTLIELIILYKILWLRQEKLLRFLRYVGVSSGRKTKTAFVSVMVCSTGQFIAVVHSIFLTSFMTEGRFALNSLGHFLVRGLNNLGLTWPSNLLSGILSSSIWSSLQVFIFSYAAGGIHLEISAIVTLILTMKGVATHDWVPSIQSKRNENIATVCFWGRIMKNSFIKSACLLFKFEFMFCRSWKNIRR